MRRILETKKTWSFSGLRLEFFNAMLSYITDGRSHEKKHSSPIFWLWAGFMR